MDLKKENNDLNMQNNDLKTENDDLKTENDDLKKRLNILESMQCCGCCGYRWAVTMN